MIHPSQVSQAVQAVKIALAAILGVPTGILAAQQGEPSLAQQMRDAPLVLITVLALLVALYALKGNGRK